jgi:2-deoxy-D-gluconate 3-dehydrogenase
VEKQVEALTAFMVKTYGGIDILINSQGTVHLQPAAEFDIDTWQRVMDVNVRSMVLTCKHAGRIMLEKKKGKIINISSVRAFQGRAGDLAYAPSKGAVNQLTRSLAIEWGPLGINVNGIAPVFTLTAISAAMLNDPVKRDWVLGRIPMKRLGEPEDVFGPAIFLASEASNFVNGHTLPVDGGWLGA